MRTVILLGSRNPEGQTGRAASALAEGIRQGGGEAETIVLPEAAIERCRQCDADGWGRCRREGRCTIEDDFEMVAARVRRADTLACVTPVYWSDLSESLRAFLERLRRSALHPNGKEGIEGKKAIGVCVAGGGGGGGPACTDTMTWVLSTAGFNVVDMVAARRQNLQMKLPILEMTGRWLAKGAPEE